MKNQKHTYRFYDPNPSAVTVDYLLKILTEANTKKVESAIQTAENAWSDTKKNPDVGHPA